jgi:hypothetical protein
MRADRIHTRAVPRGCGTAVHRSRSPRWSGTNRRGNRCPENSGPAPCGTTWAPPRPRAEPSIQPSASHQEANAVIDRGICAGRRRRTSSAARGRRRARRLPRRNRPAMRARRQGGGIGNRAGGARDVCAGGVPAALYPDHRHEHGVGRDQQRLHAWAHSHAVLPRTHRAGEKGDAHGAGVEPAQVFGALPSPYERRAGSQVAGRDGWRTR